MVGNHVKSVEAQDKYCPLGFYVTFRGGATPICADRAYLAAKTFPILTAIALRMTYSVVADPPNVKHNSCKGLQKVCEGDRALRHDF